jgi:biotin carboxyl carrier protein
MDVEVTIEGVVRLVRVTARPGGGWTVAVDDGPEHEVEGGGLGPGEWSLSWGGARHTFGVHADRERVDLQLHGRDWRARVVDARRAALELGASGGAGVVATQMPGVIVRVQVSEGQEVEEGDPIVVVEAMKMENEFKAPVAGVVKTVHVEPGQTVESGETLITIEPAE